MKKKIKVPQFKNKDQEREFWSNIDLTDYFDRSDFEPILFPNLKPSSHSVSLKLPDYVIARIKEKSNQLNIPYKMLIKQYIARGVLQKAP